MTRAFEDRAGCSVPSTPAINADDYDWDSCGVPDATYLSPFSLGAVPGAIPQPSKSAQEGCIIGFMVMGEVTGVETNYGPPSDHKYKAIDQNGCLSIDTFTSPMNAGQRPDAADVTPAEVGDMCILGYWGPDKGVTVFEKLDMDTVSMADGSYFGDLDSSTGDSTFAIDTTGKGNIVTELVDGNMLIVRLRQTYCHIQTSDYGHYVTNIALNRWGDVVAFEMFANSSTQWWDLDGNSIDAPTGETQPGS